MRLAFPVFSTIAETAAIPTAPSRAASRHEAGRSGDAFAAMLDGNAAEPAPAPRQAPASRDEAAPAPVRREARADDSAPPAADGAPAAMNKTAKAASGEDAGTADSDSDNGETDEASATAAATNTTATAIPVAPVPVLTTPNDVVVTAPGEAVGETPSAIAPATLLTPDQLPKVTPAEGPDVAENGAVAAATGAADAATVPSATTSADGADSVPPPAAPAAGSAQDPATAPASRPATSAAPETLARLAEAGAASEAAPMSPRAAEAAIAAHATQVQDDQSRTARAGTGQTASHPGEAVAAALAAASATPAGIIPAKAAIPPEEAVSKAEAKTEAKTDAKTEAKADARRARETDLAAAIDTALEKRGATPATPASAADKTAMPASPATAAPSLPDMLQGTVWTLQPHAAAPAAIGLAQGASPPFAATEAAVPLAGLAVEIAARATSGRSRFDIRLDPPELGRVDVRMDVDRSGQVTTHLIVDRSETLDLLRRDAPQLQQALQDSGLKTGDGALQFSLRDQSQGQTQRDNSGRQSAQLIIQSEDTPPADIAGRSYGRMLGASGGLDIRV
ncbi:MAG: flagellar hook-length control protein FliK [Xanthobacteraceae bacterium]|nr:MAG: flagellar hook-length control protein FliK [Xanthobacteraceae bacterium]